MQTDGLDKSIYHRLMTSELTIGLSFKVYKVPTKKFCFYFRKLTVSLCLLVVIL